MSSLLPLVQTNKVGHRYEEMEAWFPHLEMYTCHISTTFIYDMDLDDSGWSVLFG